MAEKLDSEEAQIINDLLDEARVKCISPKGKEQLSNLKDKIARNSEWVQDE